MLPPRGVNFPADSPWNALLDGLRDVGHAVAGFGGVAASPDAIVAMNDQPDARRLQTKFNISPRRSALVVLEPRVTSPAMYRVSALSRYGHRFAASPYWARIVRGTSFPWPQDLTPRAAASFASRAFTATMINGEKRSAIAGSLYGLRRSVIQAFDGAGMDFAVAGPGWDDSVADRIALGSRAIAKAAQAGVRPDVTEAMSAPDIRPHHWLGSVDDKAMAFAHSSVTVVLENSLDYVSEKLIDAVVNQVVPIYVGPPLDLFGFPPNLAVVCSPNAQEVLKAVVDLSPEQAARVLETGRAWLTSPDAASHEISRVLRELGRSIGQTID